MDREHFDLLTHLIANSCSRRQALATLIGVAFLRYDPAETVASQRHRRKSTSAARWRG